MVQNKTKYTDEQNKAVGFFIALAGLPRSVKMNNHLPGLGILFYGGNNGKQIY